ncbi:MAG: hypothetical protein ACE5EX_09955 [Phycisphaerae bacterium]
MTDDHEQAHAGFPTTHWSLIHRAGGAEATRAGEALERLLTRYLPALRAYLIETKRIDAHRADDLLQTFVSTKFLEQNLATVADPDRGRFRTLVLTALDRFLVSQQRRRSAKKRRADEAATLDPEALQAAAARPHPRPGADSFDVEWARQLLAEAVRRMEADCAVPGRQAMWTVFQARILDPILKGAEPTDYTRLVERFNFASPTQAANALTTAKRMFQRVLRSIVAEYATTNEQIDEEIRDLHEILSNPGAGSR